MKRVLVLSGMLLCALVISYVNAFPNEQQEQNVENIQSTSFYDVQDASGTSGRAFAGSDVRGVRGIPSRQSPGSLARMMQSPRMGVEQPSPQNDQQQVFADRPQFVQDVQDRDELNRFLERNTLLSDADYHFQMYVTPDNETVLEYLQDSDLDDKYDIYEAALSWVWVSDSLLNGQEEAWLYPAEFLTETPDYSSNPVSGTIVSDCEEQANTLASLLIASGEYNESSVRVSIGYVDFRDGITGGHAWVEVYEDGEWFPLDATMGPYYDEDENEVVAGDEDSTDYYHFTTGSYPVMELWYYYNDEYFVDVISQTGNAPDNWKEVPSSYS
jgi:hypothetical protein